MFIRISHVNNVHARINFTSYTCCMSIKRNRVLVHEINFPQQEFSEEWSMSKSGERE